MKKLLVLLVLAITVTPAFAGDIYVKVKTHADAMQMMGQSQPARDDVSEQWFSATKAAQTGGDRGFIVDLEKKVAYIINNKTKTYVEMALPLDLTTILPPEAKAMAPMMQMVATVTPTDETKTIGDWRCTGYDAKLTVMGMQMNMRVWASTGVPADLVTFAASVMPVFMQGQMFMSDASMKEFQKIKGFQVATEINADIMGAKMHNTTETVEISKKTAPAGMYEPPAGYEKKAALTMQDLQRR